MSHLASCSSHLRLMRFNWHLLDWCNYQCSYCNAGNAVSKNFKDKSLISDNHRITLARLKLVDQPFEVCLVGGEPTLYPHLESLLEELSCNDKLKNVFFFTNLSRSVEYLTNLQLISPKIMIHASYHPEYHSDAFVDKCKEVGCSVHVSMVDDNKWWDQTEDVIKQLVDNDIEYTLNILHPTSTWKPDYTDEFWDRFSKYDVGEGVDFVDVVWDNGEEGELTTSNLVEMKLDRFKGYLCTPESYRIEKNGDVFNVCTNRKVPLSMKGIVRDVVCPHEICHGGLVFYPKRLQS